MLFTLNAMPYSGSIMENDMTHTIPTPMTLDEQLRIITFKKNRKGQIEFRPLGATHWRDHDEDVNVFNFVEFEYRPRAVSFTAYCANGYWMGRFKPTFDRREDCRQFVLDSVFKMPKPEVDPDCTGIGGVTLPPGWPTEREINHYIIEVKGETFPKW